MSAAIMHGPLNDFHPVSPAERLRVLDVLRGCALLGILLMNIPYFALPMAAYANPNLWGGNDGANLWTFFAQWTLFEGKMRALFSILFGAGILLFIERAVARRDSVEVADLFARRMLWLMLFGALHAWFIWFGDILYPYAVCGLLIFPLRRVRPARQFVGAAAALMLLTLGMEADGFHKRSQREAAMAAQAAAASGATLTREQIDAIDAWDEVLEQHAPTREQMQDEIDAYRGGYLGALRERASVVTKFHFIPVYFPVLFDMWALMLIGMGLYSLGILQGERPMAFYLKMAAIGYAVGLPVNAASAYLMYVWNFDIVGNIFANAPMQFGRVATALAHLAVIVIVVKRGWLTPLADRLASVGRMAFSNYIAHSLICSVIFYGPGLRLMGELQRYQLYFVVLGIWVFNLVWSHWWLADTGSARWNGAGGPSAIGSGSRCAGRCRSLLTCDRDGRRNVSRRRAAVSGSGAGRVECQAANEKEE